jgi:uncharacterized phage-associated protein
MKLGKTMTYRAIDVANWFISQFDKEAGDVITHLKIQKLLYFSEAWCQVLLERELFSENMEAWAHGPVVRDVFNQFSGSSWGPLSATSEVIEFDEDVRGVLSQVLDAYGNVAAKTLEHLTHQDKPWKDARGTLSPEARCSNVIDKASIKDYFNEKYSDEINGE